MRKIQAIILAGGQGSRLRPYTTVLPKPLMPVGEFPIAEIIIRQLKAIGLTNIVMSTGHLAGLIEAYFKNGQQWGVKIKYVMEDRPLGTAGAIKLIPNLEDHFLVINGDVLTDMDFSQMLRYHKKQKNFATIAIKERTVKTDFGVILKGKRDELVDYIEKPEHKSFVSIGVNVLNKQCREYIPGLEAMGMPELMLKMKAAGKRVGCFETKDMWLDLGRLEDLELSQEVFLKNRNKFFVQ